MPNYEQTSTYAIQTSSNHLSIQFIRQIILIHTFFLLLTILLFSYNNNLLFVPNLCVYIYYITTNYAIRYDTLQLKI